MIQTIRFAITVYGVVKMVASTTINHGHVEIVLHDSEDMLSSIKTRNPLASASRLRF